MDQLIRKSSQASGQVRIVSHNPYLFFKRPLTKRGWTTGTLIVILAWLLIWAGPSTALGGTQTADFYCSSIPTYRFTLTYSTLDDLISQITSSTLPMIDGFNPLTDAIYVYSNYQGLPITLITEAGSSNLLLEIPALGYSQTFTGASRSAAVTSLQTYIQSDQGKQLLNQISAFVTYGTGTGGDSGGGSSSGGGCFISTLF
ncbi:MAG: hypothetical protein HQK55_18290 [Deltaproteobacteria bacterium]|nr:hypothetical protein [Deltaproteobacteria bacterium]